MKLNELIQDLAIVEKRNCEPSPDIAGIVSDSRRVAPGSVFVACPGSKTDGHLFYREAVDQRASVLVGEKPPLFDLPAGMAFVRVQDSREALAALLDRYHGYPARKLRLIGVTGTNGKTTVAFLIRSLLGMHLPAAYIGTLGYETPQGSGPLSNTTPGTEELFSLLGKMMREGVRAVSLEISSHALEQKRVCGLPFELALFTGLSPEHLDYHGTLDNYFQAKRLLFTREPRPKQFLINQDSPYGVRLLEENPGALTYSLLGEGSYRVREIELSFEGSQFLLEWKGEKERFRISLPLLHNVANAVAALASLDLLGFDPRSLKLALENFSGVPGRMERIEGNGYQIFVDYAHTPDAFQNVLTGVRQLRPKRVLTLFGCGGDRDPYKRPEMARIAYHYSDVVILTSDNPRTEDPAEILRQIRQGLPSANPLPPKVREIVDRREAMGEILSQAEPGDVVLILGKGHESYQILGRQRIHFDDREVVREFLKARQATLR